jgi:hypothetical protein
LDFYTIKKITGTTGTIGTIEFYKSSKRLNYNKIQKSRCSFPMMQNLEKRPEIIKILLS